ncbi:MAG: FKBP-type peptidyl-prolyl cis-trans isomerase [Ignavibacteriae bacterium]|nr:FKBP-type peptidyl-prolyl cis-trans isomerase [Saprospiraceae bacterium]MCB0731593.1 FKBP-type peptidyl-prolyl cis-trans isomerase [Ignavibacteriota bacterium]MCB9328564.1 FKBP-type peptidyl-prolyl cis-trans isomerase [Lewinellaceae bacterium]HPK10128.1 FKBP-type peptidyl-prolyl cis-trans isomerase [Saprospiraceae bacterium]HRX29004.1 FKBP-type peptidyl-prolyl cis-trans isomerase [Saprospiraceae bacterium]
MKTKFLVALASVLMIYACNGQKKRMVLKGIQYEYLITNEAGKSANPGDYMMFALETIGKDKVLDSQNDENNLPFLRIPKIGDMQKPNTVVEIVEGLKEGEKVKIYMPIDSIPNARSNPELDSLKELIYEVEVRNIYSEDEYKAMQQEKVEAAKVRADKVSDQVNNLYLDYKNDKIEWQTTDSGLKYYIVEEGTGMIPEKGKVVNVDYYGVLASDGTKFDDSFSRGQAFKFPLGEGRVIPGWDEGIALLKGGTKAMLYVPYTLAYGEAGTPGIPAKSDLMFYVELRDK